MSVPNPPNIPPAPSPAPTRQDPASFRQRGDDYHTFLVPHVNETLPAVINWIKDRNEQVLVLANSAELNSELAQQAVIDAQFTVGVKMWDANLIYVLGENAISPIDFQTYRRKVAGISATDPSIDVNNWERVGIDAYTKAETYSKEEVYSKGESNQLLDDKADKLTTYTKDEVDIEINTAVASAVASAVPAGSVVFFAMSTTPSGYLKANGAAVSRTTFSDLFDAIGTTYGAGNGSTTFTLPDLRSEFLRGWDDGRGVDVERAFGSAQADNIRESTFGVREGEDAPVAGWVPTGAFSATSAASVVGRIDTSTGTGTTLTTIKLGSAPETRSRNVALLACIKF